MPVRLDYKAVKRLFHGEGLSLALIVGFLVLGTVSCALPLLWKFSETWVLVLESVGAAVISGGVITAIIFIGQFAGVFKAAVAEVMYDEQFLENRKDLSRIWRNVTTVVYGRRSPEIAKLIIEAFERIFSGKDFYYQKDFSRELFVDWHDRQKRVLKVVDHVSTTIVPHADQSAFAYEFDWTIDPRMDAADIPPSELVGIWADRIPVQPVITSQGRVQKFQVPMQSGAPVVIDKHATLYIQIDIDPVFMTNFTKFCLRTRLRVHSALADLHVILYSSGSPDILQAPSVNEGGPIMLDRTHEGLISPGQGFILVFGTK